MPITKKNKLNPKNDPNQTSKLDSLLSKKRDRREYSKQRYQAKKQEYHEWYLRRKEQKEQQEKQQLSKYYGAEAIKVLMPFKEYTELNQEKKQLWLDFNWTMKECQESIKEGLADIVAIMKLEQVANKLTRDYWDTAKSEEKQKGKLWNSLDYDEQQRLVKYWSYEKSRIENGYIEEEERLEKQSQKYLKEIELAKYHEERGKIKCVCYSCEAQREIQKEVKVKWKQELDSYDQKQGSEKEQCPECQKWVKELDEEAGVCKGCKQKYE